ncbi:MAG: GAF domain-containing protein [Gemmatimonadetes bacterium]|nr:GAF domain-containing protein [Dehalococcoidia bacterium]MYJ12685.1 GAF domain-containing protein [Gemmatimonadota bacterium]
MDHEDSAQVASLRERLSTLSKASLRISESLDYDTVLQGVLDSARALTRARYGVITVLDGAGGIEEFLSSGFTPEEEERLWGLPENAGLIEHLGEVPGPLRLADFRGHLQALGLPDSQLPVEASVIPFLGMPIRHQGERAGHFFLAAPEGGEEFSDDDEATLVMFASQAAMVISNASRYREEQKARADLETLVDTSPVGVVVIDARTGLPVSLNREAARIVSSLHEAGASPQDLLEVLTARRADGREVSLHDLSMTQALSSGETVRAEEVVLSVPDGRSVTTLVNATPIRAEGGEVETVVITVQDMTALDELERLRAEFLAMVSHELRTPLATLKGSVTTLLDPPAALSPTESHQFFRIIDAQIDRMHVMVSDLLDVARIETGTLAISPEPTDVALLLAEARDAFTSGGGRQNVEIETPPDLPWVMADRLRIVQVLGNLLANAARNSPETSTLQVKAVAEGVHVACSVADRGRGIPAESLPPPLPQVLPHRCGSTGRRHRAGSGHLRGHRGGTRRSHLGGKRRPRAGRAFHLHDSDGGGGGVRHAVPSRRLSPARADGSC